MSKLKNSYDVCIIFLAVMSISFVIMDYFSIINIEFKPYSTMDNIILVVFALDYFYRFYKSNNKFTFFKNNVFDLIAIIPFNSIFTIFRVSRVFRIARLSKIARLTRLLGTVGKLQLKLKRFLNTNGFKYLLYISITLILLSSFVYSLAENVPFMESLWWAISTTTTVGYGDISPITSLGKLAAVILMFLGIGFIGMLTGSITSFFTKENTNTSKDRQIEELNIKLDYLISKVNDLENK